MMQGGKLAGGNPENGRVDNDFYATDPAAVEQLFKALRMYDNDFTDFSPFSFMEPCVGNGNIANATLNYFNFSLHRPESVNTFVDIVDRGYTETIVQDFMTFKPERKYQLIVTNPPYSIALDFVKKCLEHLEHRGYLAMFLKIQFWEGEKRKQFLLDNPPAFCFPFSKRMPTWNNGQQWDENGKRWATTMCHAWFVWKKDYCDLCRTVPI